MSDYSFMKSGFNMVEEPKNEEDIIALVAAFMVNSLRNCGIYISHCNRNGITREDIKRLLMLEVFLFVKRPNIIENIEEMKTILNQEDSDEENEEDINEFVVDDDEIDEFCLSKCECAMCKCVNNIYTRWDNWVPQTNLEKSLKQHFSNK